MNINLVIVGIVNSVSPENISFSSRVMQILPAECPGVWIRPVVFLTHEHFDHINGLNKLRDKIPCTVYAHAVCSRNIGLEKSKERFAFYAAITVLRYHIRNP